ncbi:MAG: hypothetical protein HQL73_07865 [Magnetococcales bacterium]|nr:hypothetical protein [Magnetococcales bacterium]
MTTWMDRLRKVTASYAMLSRKRRNNLLILALGLLLLIAADWAGLST